MINIFNKPETILISLGWTCRPALFAKFIAYKRKLPCERQVFDWLGTPMWAINRLISNNFEEFLNKEHIVSKKRLKNGDTTIYIHKLYNIRFLHDFIPTLSDNSFKNFKDKYERRIERFQSLLTSDKTLFFIRIEYDETNIVEYDEYNQEKENDKFHVEKFADTLIAKGTKYMILYLTYTWPQFFDKERRIIYVHFDKNPSNVLDERELYRLVDTNKEFIEACSNHP
jgi:hypothetical protein